ncbi:MAG: hypothetical protein WAK91_15440 [Candidatus Acidiferrales bacterium]|jgi:hypothetical protein
MPLRGYGRLLSILALPVWLSLSTSHAFAQAPRELATQSQLTLPQVVEKLVTRNAERAKALEGYKGRRFYVLDYVGFPSGLHADMTVEMTYNAPSTKEFHIVSENGSKLIVNRVLKRLLDTEQEALEAQNRQGVELNPSNYEFTALEYDRNSSGCSYILSVQPKIATKFLYRGRVWVDNKDFAVCRIEAQPAKNPSFWIRKTQIHHTYEKVGEFWLPVENQSVSDLRLDGRATLTIKYMDYEIQPEHFSLDSSAVTAGH